MKAACLMQGLAETLLTLDMPGRICGPDMKPGARVKLSPLGCAMLTTLLSFPQVYTASHSPLHVARFSDAAAQLGVAIMVCCCISCRVEKICCAPLECRHACVCSVNNLL